MEMRWRSPPDRQTPAVPTTVSMPAGSLARMSSQRAAASAAPTSSREASGRAARTLSRMLALNNRVFWKTKAT